MRLSLAWVLLGGAVRAGARLQVPPGSRQEDPGLAWLV